MQDIRKWSVMYRPSNPFKEIGNFFVKPRKVADASTLERALQSGDKFAEKKVGRGMYLQ